MAGGLDAGSSETVAGGLRERVALSLAMVQRYARTYSSEQAVAAHASFSPVGQLTA
jgi:hypothetical protein